MGGNIGGVEREKEASQEGQLFLSKRCGDDGGGLTGVSVGSNGDFDSTVSWHKGVYQVIVIQNKFRLKVLIISMAP